MMDKSRKKNNNIDSQDNKVRKAEIVWAYLQDRRQMVSEKNDVGYGRR